MRDVATTGGCIGITARSNSAKLIGRQSRVVKIKRKRCLICSAVLVGKIGKRVKGDITPVAAHPSAKVKDVDDCTRICAGCCCYLGPATAWCAEVIQIRIKNLDISIRITSATHSDHRIIGVTQKGDAQSVTGNTRILIENR